MAKRPGIYVYDGDWVKDNVAGCSLGAQGLLLRMMFIGHNSERYGYLQQNGAAIPPESIARRCGCTPEEYATLLQELDAAAVLSRTPTGIIFSRRMVRDEAERVAATNRKQKQRGKESHECHGSVPSTPEREKEKEVNKEIETAFLTENFDGQEQFELLCQVYSKAERSLAASQRFFEAVEWVVSTKQKTRTSASLYIRERAKIYCSIKEKRYQQGLTNWLENKTFEQSESVWSEGNGNARGIELIRQGRSLDELVRAAENSSKVDGRP